jgi:hypothetical protein
MMRSSIERQLMKAMNRILFLAVTTAGLAFTASALADGPAIAASPRVRQMLDDRAAQTLVAVGSTRAVSAKECCASENLAASPKVQQMLSAQPKCCAVSATSDPSTVSRPDDGIAASPKLRQQLNERSTEFQIAPIK